MANFDRDFGYLMPFLEKVEGAASAAPAELQAELRELLSGEKARWQRIQSLLSGRAAPKPRAAQRAAPAPAAAPRAPAAPAQAGFTVGSLRRRS